MALTCKTGTYNRVLKELLELNIPKGDVFLLFGPMDILIQFKDLQNLDEFIKKWFNPVRMIGYEESLITKTLTFIVISEGPLFPEEPFAIIFLNTQPQNLEKVRKKLLTFPEVLSADTVFGPYDIISPVKAKNIEDLEQIIWRIQDNTPGIIGSATAIVAILRI
jgi:DNA-binding Lrp family transcriptional regulator